MRLFSRVVVVKRPTKIFIVRSILSIIFDRVGDLLRLNRKSETLKLSQIVCISSGSLFG